MGKILNYKILLWFDVGFKRYTTKELKTYLALRLWFDVGFKRYTTERCLAVPQSGCGLM